MSTFVLYGATGMIGSRILAEARRRGHAVIAVSRNPQPSASDEGLDVRAGDVLDHKSVASTAVGADVAISAYGPAGAAEETLPASIHALLAGLTTAKVSRLIVVGGAGSLEAAPGVRLVDSPQFPPEFVARARAQAEQLTILRATESSISWTYVSPSALIAPGERTGHFRVGHDKLLVDATGKSSISAEDFAIAVVDEAEQAAHPNQRITVGY